MKAGKSHRCSAVKIALVAALPAFCVFIIIIFILTSPTGSDVICRCMVSMTSAYASMALSMYGAIALISLTTSGEMSLLSRTMHRQQQYIQHVQLQRVPHT